MSSEKSPSTHAHVYAIVRFDFYASASNIEHSATVVKVFASQDTAEKEASRLREVNEGKDCTYVVQITRFVETAHTSVS